MFAILASSASTIPATISAAWSAIVDVAGGGGTANEDRTISFGGGSRSVTLTYSGTGSFRYRINSGSWTAYSTAFSINHAQTLAWEYTAVENELLSLAEVKINGVSLASFTVSGSGFP